MTQKTNYIGPLGDNIEAIVLLFYMLRVEEIHTSKNTIFRNEKLQF